MPSENHLRRVRCYEFEYVVPWEKLIEKMKNGGESRE